MYGNPGDYAWGRGGLDVIVTQLLNQMDGFDETGGQVKMVMATNRPDILV